MKKNKYGLITGIGVGIMLTLGLISVAQTNKSQSNEKLLCSGQFPNGTYTGKFDVKAADLGYYTEYLEIEDGEIRIYPTFNSQTRELNFYIEADDVKVECK